MNRALLCLAALSVLTIGCRNELDDGVPRLYKCERDGGEACPGGWKCGLDGYCQDPGQHLPYRCEHSSDCEGNWHCGVRGVCYDPNQDTSQPCRIDAGLNEGSDCADGWRCGLESSCHPLDAGAAYQCGSDFDCEAQWRCGQEHVCVDVNEQALGTQTVNLSISKLSPQVPDDAEQIALTPFVDNGGGNMALAWSRGSDLSVFLAGPQDVSNPRRFDLKLPGKPTSLVIDREAVLASGQFGVVNVTWAGDGGTVDVVSTSPITQLVHDEAAFYGQGVCGYTSSSVTPFPPLKSTFFPGDLPSGVTVNDVTPWEPLTTFGSGQMSLLAATNQGFYFAPNDGGYFPATDGGASNAPQFRPVYLPGIASACSGNAPEIARVRYFGSSALLAATTANDAAMYVWQRAGYPPGGAECDVVEQMPLVWGPCAPCGQGETLVDVGSTPASSPWPPAGFTPFVETLCRSTSGSLVRYKNVPSTADAGSCVQEQLPIRESAAKGMTLDKGTDRADGIDRIGMPLTCAGPECEALLFDGIADRVVGNGDRLLVFPPTRLENGSLRQDLGGWMTKGAGLLPFSPPDLYLAGGIDERPDLAISGSTFFGSDADRGLRVSKLDAFVDNSGGPYTPSDIVGHLRNSSDYMPAINGGFGLTGTPEIAHGIVASDADGGQWLAVGVGDRIWATPGADQLGADGGVTEVDIKLVPLSYGRFQSLTLGAPAPNTKALLEGYAVVSQRLFRITVPTSQLWLSDEIRLQDAVPLKVWREGTKGRVGTEDGRVFGLPIPVAISEKVPGGVALDFADLCGQGIALTPNGPYRLVATDGPLGNWERIPVESIVPAAADLGPTWVPPLHVSREGKLHKVIVMNKLGLVMELKAQCGD